jgi:hypothetical protein
MELNDRQRKLLFAGLVVLLAAAGVFLTIGGGGHRHSAAKRSASPTPSPPQAAPVTGPPASGPPPSPGTYDIYSMLPFSQKDFTTAADVAKRFTVAYGTYRYDEAPGAYIDRMRGMVTPDLATQLQQGAGAPGVIAQRQQDQEASTSTATLDSLRDIAKDQLIFLATGKQHITSKGGKSSDNSQQYAVTMTRSGGGWVVYAFAPSDQGDK